MYHSFGDAAVIINPVRSVFPVSFSTTQFAPGKTGQGRKNPPVTKAVTSQVIFGILHNKTGLPLTTNTYLRRAHNIHCVFDFLVKIGDVHQSPVENVANQIVSGKSVEVVNRKLEATIP